ncbi:LacI family DNA-binding transcriptional regulator [Massilia sp. CF038]|uniref:LacI family DNA-binding transcriptional regulator n=1 Tax=Massilia sp. CF038 TaxID=1881045 RepID=UPI000916B9B2|nr:substrate-binding domain-containing protein [Massilia sp. CF038]SHH47069.1 transcriptional regulator, LacI family [Massilia sp. CF038]
MPAAAALLEPNVTLELIAREAGVSPSTVSRILNGTAKVSDDKRLAVEGTIARFNFEPNLMARSLAMGQTRTIGVLTQFIESPFYGEALRGVEDALADTPYSPLFVSGHWNLKTEEARMRLLQARRVDGVIILTGRLSDQQLIKYAERMPIVVTGRQLAAPRLLSVDVDDFEGARSATRHLLELGHTRIAFITGPHDHPDAIERLRGYQQALQDAGVAPAPELVLQADFMEGGGMQAIDQLLASGADFSAVFAANDQMAYGARLALYRRNIRVPDDISLIGFDDLPNSTYSMPPLTTVRQPVYDIGRLAAVAILKLIAGETADIAAPPLELVVRESTRRLRR